MPSKGSPKILVRIPEELQEELAAIIEEANERRKGEPFTLSSWIRAAIVEKIAHTRRSRKESASVRHVELGDDGKLTFPE